MKPIRNWRILGETDSGAYCFFDPSREAISVRDLTSDEIDARLVVDVSVSGLERERDPLCSQLDFFSIKPNEVP